MLKHKFALVFCAGLLAMGAAQAVNFPMACDQYRNVSMEEMCLATKTGDAKHCDALTLPAGQDQFSQLFCVALATKKTSDCDKLAAAMSASPTIAGYFKELEKREVFVGNARNLCYADVTQDIKYCAAVVDNDAKMLCSAEKSGSASYCEKIGDKKAAMHCLFTLGKINQ